MRWRTALVVLVLCCVGLSPATAAADFGFLPGNEGFDVGTIEQDGSTARTAGSHPYEMRLHLGFRREGAFADGDLRDLHLAMPPSLFASPDAVGVCGAVAFNTPRQSPFQTSLSGESCPDETQVGVVAVHSSYEGGSTRYFGVFNLSPRYGAVEAIGFSPFGTPIVLSATIGSDAAVDFEFEGLPQKLSIYGLDIRLWGTPWAQPGSQWTFQHDNERGNCLNEEEIESPFGETAKMVVAEGEFKYIPGTCSVGGDPRINSPGAYLTLPTSCEGPMTWTATATSWQPGPTATASSVSRDVGGTPVGLGDCKPALPSAQARLTTESAASASGLEYQLKLGSGGGILNSLGVVRPPIRTVSAMLPDGLTINPSVGAGLGVCTEAEFAREAVDSAPGAGCPNQSNIGNVSIEGLIGIPEVVKGSVFLAKPYENPTDTLIGLYIVARSPRRGLLLKSSGQIVPDPHTGRLTTSFEGLPQLPYTSFGLRFREGQRAVVVSPPTCGTYVSALELTAWSQPGSAASSSSTMPITSGERGGPCPIGLRPFAPGLSAGSLNPIARAYTPFLLHMTRSDADQEITSYSASFPPGLLAKLAGVSICSDAAIATAQRRSGADELAQPSCPGGSRIGSTLVGYGVGPTLAYAPGSLYLAGPYNGAPLSVVAIDSALVGPFDLGTVIVRSAIRVDPQTAQVAIDSAGSDPIPHILKGIPIHIRDIRVAVDRPDFTLNPTSCDPFQVVSTLTGSGADPFNPGDDVAVDATDRYQALDCAVLGFKPRFKLSLTGGIRRGRYPSLRAVVRPREGDTNFRAASVALPSSIFLAQEHLKTICTERQFRAGACPPGSTYGRARVVTPLLDEPMEGPVYLRSSSHRVPDLVAAVKGRGIAIEVVGKIDSVKGGMRATFSGLPDGPFTKFTMVLPGGKRGILVNSDDLCASSQFANVRLTGQNNKTDSLRSRISVKCKRHGKPAKHRKKPKHVTSGKAG